MKDSIMKLNLPNNTQALWIDKSNEELEVSVSILHLEHHLTLST